MTIAAAALLFLLVFVARIIDPRQDSGVHLFYIIPVILLALRFGPRGGTIGALVAIALFVGWSMLDGEDVDKTTWIGPLLTVIIVGQMVGILAQALRESEHRFRTAATNNLEPFALYSCIRNGDGKIIDFRTDFINDAGAASVGMTRREMIGRSLSEVFPGRLESGLMDDYVAVVETGDPVFREAVDYINVLGEETLVRAFDIRIAKLDDGIQITWRDITDRVRMRQQRDWLVAIVENSAEAVLSVDPEHRIASWSTGATELYGYTAEEVIGKSHEFLIDEAEAERRTAYLDRVLAGESPGPIHTRERRKDGSLINTTFVGWPIVDADGHVVGAARHVWPDPQ